MPHSTRPQVSTPDRTPLRRLRHARGLTRDELAVRAGVGSATVHRIEHRQSRPHSATLLALSVALGCSPADLKDERPPAATAGARKILEDGEDRGSAG